MINKRKKLVRYRGSHTHGGGSKKKRRGSGHRGGVGMSGGGKRADHKKLMIFKLYGKKYFGKHGFKSHSRKLLRALNLEDLEKNFDYYLEKNLIHKENEMYVINLVNLGYNKLLGSGDVKHKYKIIGNISEKARLKIEKNGGLVERS